MNKTTLTMLAAAGLGLAAGCVPNEKYEALRIRAEGLEAQADQAQLDAEAAEARASALEGQLNNTAGGQSGLQSLLQQERDRNDRLTAERDQLRDAYQRALAGASAPLPEPVITDLNRFAQQNPDLVTFDPDRGIVRFTSDLTFGSGSANLRDGASAAIGRFADILTGESTSGFELLVAGHTDNVPVSNPATKRAHPNNWYLSAHRAITVAEELRKSGVAKNRLGVAGYADQRPVADNATAGGRAQNRRVEVLILPTTAPEGVEPGQPGADAAPASQTPDADLDAAVEFEDADSK